jgi:hypothetical protein
MTLLNSVLTQAGPSISRQYDKQSRLNKTLLLDGGSTSAQKILFIAWELEVQSSDTLKAQNVSNLIFFDINKLLFIILVIIKFSERLH